MTSKSPFLPRLALSRGENSILPMYNDSARHPPLRSQHSEYDLDDLSPRPEDTFLPPDFQDPNSTMTHTVRSTSNRKPTGAINRRPSNSSSGGSSSKARRFAPTYHERVLFHGPPPPIATSKVLYRDEEQWNGSKYDDHDDQDTGISASWLPGTARRAISSVIWDRSEPADLPGERPIAYDRNSVWRSLARREKAIVHDVQRYLEVQEESLGGGDATGQRSTTPSDAGSNTPTGTVNTPTSSRNPHRSVSFLEPVTKSGPAGEVIPVRQPRQKKLGIGGARKGISRSLAQLAQLKAEEEASILASLSARKQALNQLRKLATRHTGITEELKALETDGQEPLTKELEGLDGEYKGVCSEIQEIEERLSYLKIRRRQLEEKIDDVTNRREAGLSGYKNALREVEDFVKGFLARPPIKPLDLEALVENMKEGETPPSSPGGVEFLHLRPERRTTDMAREWWEAEVAILEKRKEAVDTERAALEEGAEVWQEVVNLVLEFENDLRKQMMAASTADLKGKGRETEEGNNAQLLKMQFDQINTVISALDKRLGIAEAKGWNLLIAAIGAELEAFREAADMSRAMLTTAGVAIDDSALFVPERTTSREDSGTTGTNASYHTVNSGSAILLQQEQQQQQLLDLPNNHEDEHSEEETMAAIESDNEVPPDLLIGAVGYETEGEEHHPEAETGAKQHIGGGDGGATTTSEITTLDREDSENEVPPEFLVEHHDTRD